MHHCVIGLQNNLDKLSASVEENSKLTPLKAEKTSTAVVDKSLPAEGVRTVTYDDKNLVKKCVFRFFIFIFFPTATVLDKNEIQTLNINLVFPYRLRILCVRFLY